MKIHWSWSPEYTHSAQCKCKIVSCKCKWHSKDSRFSFIKYHYTHMTKHRRRERKIWASAELSSFFWDNLRQHSKMKTTFSFSFIFILNIVLFLFLWINIFLLRNEWKMKNCRSVEDHHQNGSFLWMNLSCETAKSLEKLN